VFIGILKFFLALRFSAVFSCLHCPLPLSSGEQESFFLLHLRVQGSASSYQRKNLGLNLSNTAGNVQLAEPLERSGQVIANGGERVGIVGNLNIMLPKGENQFYWI
jgi:hypothetical protein